MVVALAAALPAYAQEELAKKHNCFACHAVDKKLVGPSYKDVAAKYRDDPKAEAKLFEKVKKGGQGVWGQVPMPPNSAVPDADIHSLVKWILSQK
jgi:cytochrome c